VPVVSVIDEEVNPETGEVLREAEVRTEWKGFCGKLYKFRIGER
jgi:hypothetical protein